MPRSSYDDWDTPGGPGGREELERRRGPTTTGAASALYWQWREAVAEISIGRIFKTTVNRAEFNTFRRARLDEGITDAQLAESFHIFATAVTYGPVRVRHGDLWRSYTAQWSRWVGAVSAPTTRPWRGRTRSPDWQP